MERIVKSVEVDVGQKRAYDAWSRFEDFPKFMKGVENVRQVSNGEYEWTAKVGGKEKSWTAELVEAEPHDHITWKALEGDDHRGAVSFSPLGRDQTVVQLAIDYDPDGFFESIGDAMGVVERRVEGDLERFKEAVERGTEA